MGAFQIISSTYLCGVLVEYAIFIPPKKNVCGKFGTQGNVSLSESGNPDALILSKSYYYFSAFSAPLSHNCRLFFSIKPRHHERCHLFF